VATVAVAACGSSSSSSPAELSVGWTPPSAPVSSPVSLSETGSTLLYPLFKLRVADYKTEHPQVAISTAGTGSGTGISSAAGGSADIGASDAYLTPTDAGKYPTLLNIPLAISAQMVNYNLPGLEGTLKLNGTVLAEMYEGKITWWNDPAIAALNPGVSLPRTRVVPLVRSDSSGDTFLFTSYLSHQDPGWASSLGYNTTIAWPPVPGELAFKGNGGMVTGCQATLGCVAYIGISYRSDIRAAGLGEAELANGADQYELPTAATIAAAAGSFPAIPATGTMSLINSSAAGSYPIINYEYAIVNSIQPSVDKAQDIQALLYWAITTGNSARYLSQVNFLPLSSAALAVSETLIAKIAA
jgi:phosphate transport system substrate-binding protein